MTGLCDVCGQTGLRPYRHEWLRRCAACGVLRADLPVRIADQASPDEIDEAARAAGLDGLRRRNNQALLAALARLAPAGGRLLDVGAGPGFLLQQADAAGFAAEGIEPDAAVLAAARRHGAEVRQGFFPDAVGADERFDVIVFNDVLEHIPDLAAALAACARHLRPGGILCLNCPDSRGLFFRVAAGLDRLGIGGPYDRLWQRGLPSPHLWYFTPALLARAAARAGFAPAGTLRLAAVELDGLWSRIMARRGESRLLALASWLFAAAALPVSRLFPSDATAAFFRKPAG